MSDDETVGWLEWLQLWGKPAPLAAPACPWPEDVLWMLCFLNTIYTVGIQARKWFNESEGLGIEAELKLTNVMYQLLASWLQPEKWPNWKFEGFLAPHTTNRKSDKIVFMQTFDQRKWCRIKVCRCYFADVCTLDTAGAKQIGNSSILFNPCYDCHLWGGLIKLASVEEEKYQDVFFSFPTCQLLLFFFPCCHSP